ncbi:T9SS type A sorting domain-containing protein [Dyadobacter pollutisoli]|uniref:T9SS type A sorting domain-containing protein n=1 Tax=Dyadobacter pollutisoli TaxID=2910158 RepID=A0A9E8SK41_9BACT|nr:T9SS type A sorting domain-containing protein [Dyadobacter pollutisoli]WAC11568.1 T9SS type A sorting domain-containing protein [Dyadobacter pollutisoli]
MVKWLQILFFLFTGPVNLYAQLVITSPVNNQIMQRDADGNATIPVTGYAHFPYKSIAALLTPIEGNVHKAKQWSFSQEQVEQGFLNTVIKAETGWYQLKLIGYSDEGITDSVTVPRVGVGEVLMVTGNSNAMGLPGLGAKSMSSQVISMNMVNKTLNAENITVAPDDPMQPPQFEILKSDNYIFPNGETAWYWGKLGEMLSKRWNTPVLFFNAAWAAANSENYRDAASGKDAYNLYVGKFWPNRQPYSNIVNTIRYFASWSGIRAVLWSHGENDAQLRFKEDDYFNYIRTLIANSRLDTGYNIPWVIARNSASNTQKEPYLPILNAQNRLTEIKNFNIFKGPYLDTIQIPRPVSGHFENVTGGLQGLTLAATSWNRSLPDSIVKKIIPIQPAYFIHTGVTPARLYPGASFTLPYELTGEASGTISMQAELLDKTGKYVANAGSGTKSPLAITIPPNVPNGDYRLRLTASKPVLPGSVSDEFYVNSNYKEVEFVNTIAARIESQSIYVSWLLAADPELKQMILQKTTDGTNYNDLQSFAGAGTVSQVYGYKDNNPGGGSIFYRLRMEYANGTVAYSTIVTIFLNGAPPDLLVFPNPVANQQFYLKAKTGTTIQCMLFDISGNEHPVYTSDREAIGLITVRPVYHLPSGVYILKTVTDTGSTTQRILFK